MWVLIRDVPTHPAIGITDLPVSDPIDLTRSGQLIQHRRGVVGYPCWQDHRLHGTGWHRVTRELFNCAEHSIDASATRANALPFGKEPSKGDLVDRLHVFAEQRKGSPLDQRKDLAVAVLTSFVGCLSRHVDEGTGYQTALCDQPVAGCLSYCAP